MYRILLTLVALVATMAIGQAADLGDDQWRGTSRHGVYRTMTAPHPRIVRPHYSYRIRVGMLGPAGWYRPEPRLVEEWAYPEPAYEVPVYPYPYEPFARPCGCY